MRSARARLRAAALTSRSRTLLRFRRRRLANPLRLRWLLRELVDHRLGARRRSRRARVSGALSSLLATTRGRWRRARSGSRGGGHLWLLRRLRRRLLSLRRRGVRVRAMSASQRSADPLRAWCLCVRDSAGPIDCAGAAGGLVSNSVAKLGLSSHGREKVVTSSEVECDACGEERFCLGFDTSDDEYGPVWICAACAFCAYAKVK